MVLTTRSIANCVPLGLALFFQGACGGEDGSNETGSGPAGDLGDLGGSDVQPGDTCSGDLTAPAEGFVRIAGGTFTMGSPSSELGWDSDETQHEVTLTRDFWLQTTEVTQGAYQALMGSNPSSFTACGASCPVEQVSWYDAIAYANARSRAEGLPECYDGEGNVIGGTTVYECCGYRLPTEAEWEYAARAGMSTATYRGDLTGDPFSCDPQPSLDSIAWFCGNAGDQTQVVGGKAPNAWGLYDMLGNVW
jgi:formylglycine-generating enzyme required for sulfatase activity